MKLDKFLLIVCISISFFFSFSPVKAQTRSWDDIGAEYSVDCTINGTATIQGLMCLVANVMSVTLAMLGIAGFVMLVYGSITLLLSGGSSQMVENSKKTITFAFVGLILALSSFLIMNLIAEFTGINVIKKFLIPPSETGVNDMKEWEQWDN